MPISKDRFNELGDDDNGPTPGTNAAKILDFLRENPGKAFTQNEIAAATEVKKGSVGPTLVRLRQRGRVDHRGKYWGVSDHDQSLDAAAGQAAATLAEHETDEETPEMAEWSPHAVDPRDHRDEQ
jgi:hypothetical protein